MNNLDHDILIRIDQNLKNLCETVSSHTEEDKVSFGKQESRINKLEQAYWKAFGGFSVIILIIQVVLKMIKV